MRECTDNQLGQKLSAYELGLLSGSELEDFEQHLFECDHCFEKAEQFRGPARLIRADQYTRQVVLDEVDSDGESARAKTTSVARKWWGLSAFAAIVFIVLILVDWEIQIKPSQEAHAHEALLAIMYFDDMTESGEHSRLGEIITDLLITDLSESEFVSVVSSQRLYDILSLLGYEGVKTVNKDLASQVARKSNAKYMLTGSLLQTEPTVIITAQIVDVQSGNIVASQRVMGNPEDNLFASVDRLSEEVKVDLSLPQQAYAEDDRTICDISSCSIGAYQHYLEGMEHYYRSEAKEADQAFASAIEADTTFCMAYYRRALVTSGEEHKQMIKKAVEFKPYASKKEQRYISALAFLDEDKTTDAIREYQTIIRDYPDEKEAHESLGWLYGRHSRGDLAVEHYEKALEIDPQYNVAMSVLARQYDYNGDLDKSLETYARYIELWPDDWGIYSTRGETYAVWGYFDAAIADWRKALELRPEQHHVLFKMAMLGLITADYHLLDSCLSIIEVEGSEPRKFDAAFIRCIIPYRKGQIQQAIELLNEFSAEGGRVIDFGIGSMYDAASKYAVLASIYASAGQPVKGLQMNEKYRSVFEELYPGQQRKYTGYYLHILYLAMAGRIDEASQKAEELREYMANDYDHVFYFQSLIATGGIEYMKGNYDVALVHFRSAAERPHRRKGGGFLLHFMMGKCYQATGNTQKAVGEFEDALTRTAKYAQVAFFNQEIDTHLSLAALYEEIKDNDNAIKQYRKVRDLWQDADEDVKQMYGYYDAMGNLTRLEQQL